MAPLDVERLTHESKNLDFESNHGSIAQEHKNYENLHGRMLRCVYEYTKETGISPDLLILTNDGGVMAAHQYVLVDNSLYFYHMLEQDLVVSEYNKPKAIFEESITKQGLEILLRLVYCAESKDFKLDGTKMQEYGPEVMVATSRYLLPKHIKQACVAEMKRSITPKNCGEVLKAMEICENKHYDFFYSEHGLKVVSMELLATRY